MIVDAKLRRSRPARVLPHQNRCGGVFAPSRQFRRSMPAAFGAEARRPPHQTAEIADGREHNCSRETMAFAARTPTPTVAAPIVQLCIRTQLRAVGRFSQATAGRLLRVAEPSSRLRAQAISTCCRLRTCCFGGMPCFPLLSKTLMAARIAPTMGGPADFGRRVGLGARRGCRSWSWRHPCVPEVAGLCECQTPIRAGAWRTSVAGCAD